MVLIGGNVYQVRMTVSDFAVVIAIFSMVSLQLTQLILRQFKFLNNFNFSLF